MVNDKWFGGPITGLFGKAIVGVLVETPSRDKSQRNEVQPPESNNVTIFLEEEDCAKITGQNFPGIR